MRKWRSFFRSILFLAVFLLSAREGGAESLWDPAETLLPGGSVMARDPWMFDGAAGRAIVSRAETVFHSLSSYRCLVATYYHNVPSGGADHSDEKMTLSVRFPGRVRVDLIHPRGGAWLIYRQKTNNVRIKPFSFLPMILDLNPDNSLITSRFGHTLDHSSFRSFDSRVLAPACLLGGCVYLGDASVLGHSVNIVNVAPVFGIARPVFGRMWVGFDEKTRLPLFISTEDPHGRFMERILYTHCQENLSFPPGYFGG